MRYLATNAIGKCIADLLYNPEYLEGLIFYE